MQGAAISIDTLSRLVGSDHAPVIWDGRRAAIFARTSQVLPVARPAIHKSLSPADLDAARNRRRGLLRSWSQRQQTCHGDVASR